MIYDPAAAIRFPGCDATARPKSLIKTPDCFFISAGRSEGFMPLNAFDGALLDAGVGNTNMVRMSSIVPPACRKLDRFKLPYGALVPVAYASITSSEPGQVISASVAAAFPHDDTMPGLIMEHSAVGSREEIEETCREMARSGFGQRGWDVARLESVGISHTVEKHGAAFACIVLWDQACLA